mmetsp:Transcript_7724/g.14866  ORF Transcript_7724/g.14866 Transcript_7724/m.14866 type:complete len:155 (+) Transcript_7724:39-503(+)
MLRSCDLQYEGKHHSGIDDCKNIARICLKMHSEGFRFKADDMTSFSEDYDPSKDPSIKDYNASPFASQVRFSDEELKTAVFLRGLPFSATENDIFAFFGKLEPEAVQVLLEPDGRSSGRAVAKFSDAPRASKAQAEYHRKYMSNRYIEVTPAIY